jgi:hypothetical protein
MARSAKLELAEGLRHDYARIRRLQRATGDHCGSTADRALSSAEALGTHSWGLPAFRRHAIGLLRLEHVPCVEEEFSRARGQFDLLSTQTAASETVPCRRSTMTNSRSVRLSHDRWMSARVWCGTADPTVSGGAELAPNRSNGDSFVCLVLALSAQPRRRR